MINYGLYDTLDFGKYAGTPINELATINAMYIEWCVLNVEYFVIDKETIEFIKKIYPKFLTSEISNEVLNRKIETWNKIQDDFHSSNYYRYSDNESCSNWDNEYYNDNLDLDQQSPEWWDSLQP